MILAEYDKPISGIPKTFITKAELDFGHSVIGHWPLGEMTEFRYGDRGDQLLASTRFYSFIQRTGGEMRDSLLPIRDKICGACHEIIGISCSDASMCDFSEGNKYCCHTDNAAVYPFLEWMLYLLLVGNIISASVFIEYTAWMRALSKKLYGLDRLASTRNRDTHNYQSRYRDLFGDNIDAEGMLSAEEALSVNKAYQRRFVPKIDPFLRGVTHMVQQAMEEKWTPKKSLILSEDITGTTITTARRMLQVFWTIDPPGIQ